MGAITRPGKTAKLEWTMTKFLPFIVSFVHFNAPLLIQTKRPSMLNLAIPDVTDAMPFGLIPCCIALWGQSAH